MASYYTMTNAEKAAHWAQVAESLRVRDTADVFRRQQIRNAQDLCAKYAALAAAEQQEAR